MSRWRVLLCAGLVSALFGGAADARQPLTSDERARIVEEICGILKEHYVYPRVADSIADRLRRSLRDGAYDAASDNGAFAALLTEDLRSVNQDLHLRADPLDPQPGTDEEDPDWPRIFLNYIHSDKRSNFGVASVQRFDGNIGYLELTKLKPLDPESLRIVRGAMDFLSNSDALIIDLRRNTGGTEEMTEFLLSYFFAKSVPLTGKYERETGGIAESATLADFYSDKLVDVPLYVLTSGRTISAPEGFAYDLQIHGRAKIIGERTKGASNPGRFFRVAEKISLLVATGYAVNPLTGANWEGVGVVPNVPTPADGALDKALALAAVAAEERRRTKEAVLVGYIDELKRQIAEVEALAPRDPRAAEDVLDSVVDRWVAREYLNRYFFLELGDQYLEKGHATMAEFVYRQVPRLHPDYALGYRKLADLYEAAGDHRKALAYLTKMLQLDPDNGATARRIVDCQAMVRSGGRPE